MADYAIHDTTLTGISNVIRKKEGSAALIDPADYADRINLMGMLEEKTIVSWPISDFEDGADDVPTKSLIVTIPASLSGVSAVTETQTGRNLITAPTYTTNTDSLCLDLGCNRTFSSITLSFLATNSEVDNVSSAIVDYREEDGTHHYKTLNDFRDENNVPFSASASNSGKYKNTYSNVTFRYVYISYQSSGRSKFTSDSLSNWQLEIGSTSHAFEPYQTPTVYTASLGRTIYGGQVDIVNGEGESTRIKKTVRWGDLGNVTQLADVTRKEIVLSASEEPKYITSSASTDLLNDKNLPYDMTYSGNFEHIYIANSARIWVYLANGTDADTEITVSYTLADALQTDFTFTGQEVPTRLGYNAFWSEQGDTEVTYRSSGTIYQYPKGEEAYF